MPFTVYILYSEKLDKYYKGHTSNIIERLKRHNGGYEKYTKSGVPWKLVWTAEKSTRGEAQVLEYKLKNLSQKRLLDFIDKYS